jgi:hypothetical protein
VTVNVTSSTTYSDFGAGSATIADVKVGDQVAVFGTDTSNTVTADKVGIGNPGGPGGPGRLGGPGSGGGPMGPAPTSGSESSTAGSSVSS